ncbi:MAG: diguanylate cyclase [Eubacteriales bacterium]|nr:diguanylate cyclase [Eubacteriales bacterium]
MQQGEKKRITLEKILRHFGFPLFAAVVLLVTFFITQGQMAKELRKGTYQILWDATRQQCISLEQYIGLLATRVQLIAHYDADTGPNTLVESLRTELRQSAADVEIGFANTMGDLLYSDQLHQNVSDLDWFLRSLNGETVVTICTQNKDDGLADVLVSAHVNPHSGANGVLFATLSNRNFAAQLHTLAYEGRAHSFVCDAKGTVLFVERGGSIIKPGDQIQALINDQALNKGVTVDDLKTILQQDQIVTFRFSAAGKGYYAVCESLPEYGWFVFSVASSDVADTIARQVSMQQMGMLLIILLVGVAMAAQAYEHERVAVEKLLADKELLQQSAQRYQLITRLSNEVLFQIRLDTGEISFNDSFEAMFGFQPPACTVDDLESCTSLFYELDWQVFTCLINQLRAGEAEAREELRMVNSRNVVRWKRAEIFSVYDQSGHAVQLVGKIVDIHRQKQSLQRLIRQADSEPLTGLLNRGAMERNVKGFLQGEGLGGRHALLMMDFDNFKSVNDTLGHAKGDTLLVSFAVAMRRLFRAGDYLSRIGGDEYMVFIKNIGEDGVALDKTEALREEMVVLSRKIKIPVSVSVGIAVYDRDGETFEKLYHAADEALYQVKRGGKNAVCFFSVPQDVPQNGVGTLPDEGDEICDIDGMCTNKEGQAELAKQQAEK